MFKGTLKISHKPCQVFVFRVRNSLVSYVLYFGSNLIHANRLKLRVILNIFESSFKVFENRLFDAFLQLQYISLVNFNKVDKKEKKNKG